MHILESFIHFPIFEDEDKTRAAGLLYALLLACCLGAALYAALLILFLPYQPNQLLLNVLILPILLALMVLVRRGYVRSTSMALVFIIGLMLTVSCITAGGIQSPAFTGLIIPILIGGFLLGRRAGIWLTALAIATGIALVFAEDHQWLPPVQRYNSTSTLAAYGLFFFVGTLLLNRVLGSVRRALAQTQVSAGELAKNNQILQDTIAELKQTQAALSASEQNYRQLFDANPHPMWVFDLQTLAFLAVNDAAISHYGYSREEFMEMTIKDIRPAEDIPALMETVGSQVNQSTTANGAWQHRKKDGSLITVEIATHSLKFNGREARLIAAYDITERLRAEEARRQSDELFSSVFESVPVAIAVTSLKEGRILNVNSTFTKLSGYEREEVVGKRSQEVPLFAERYDRKEMLQNIEQPGASHKQDYEWRSKSGERIHITSSSIRVNIGGEPCILGIAIDITERKRAEEAVRRSEEFFSTIFHSVPVAIGITRLSDGRIINVNNAMLEITGYKREEVMNTLAKDSPIWVDPNEWRRIAKIIYEKKAFHDREFEWRTKSGEILNILGSGMLVDLGGELCVLGIGLNITERLRAEEALRASEEQYRQLFEANPHPMFVADLETSAFLAVNEAAIAKYGYSHGEFLNMTTDDLRLPEDKASAAELIERYERDNLRYLPLGVRRHIKKDGSLLFVELFINRLTYGGRNAVVGASYDLTERLHAEKALRESEARLSGIFDSAMDAIITIDNHKNIVYFNAAAEDMFQCKCDDAIGHPISRFIPERFREEHEHHIEKFVQTGVTKRRMGAMTAIGGLRANGEEFPIEASISQFEIEAGKFHTVILRDVSERKQAEDALRRSEELFYSIFQSVPMTMGISTMDEGRILNVNRHFLDLTGFELDEVLNHSIRDIGLWSPYSQRDRLIEMFREEGRVRSVEVQWKTKSGDRLDVLLSIVPVEVEGEACILTIALDITERKRLQQEHLDAERIRMEVYKEREVLALKEHFISKMSHEFRTPLAVILGAKESLEHYYDRLKPERREEHFRNIDQQIRYLTTMLDEVLMLSKTRSGKLKFSPIRINLAAVCRKLYEQVQLTDTEQHQFEWSDDGLLSEVEGDSVLLQHILINLLSNAIKYSPQGGEIRLDMRRVGDEAIIRISDQGIGIPEADQKHLFEAFHRASNTQFIKGTGLGLAIVKESVQAHGGTITCESLEGRGTTFIVRLPIDVQLVREKPQG